MNHVETFIFPTYLTSDLTNSKFQVKLKLDTPKTFSEADIKKKSVDKMFTSLLENRWTGGITRINLSP